MTNYDWSQLWKNPHYLTLLRQSLLCSFITWILYSLFSIRFSYKRLWITHEIVKEEKLVPYVIALWELPARFINNERERSRLILVFCLLNRRNKGQDIWNCKGGTTCPVVGALWGLHARFIYRWGWWGILFLMRKKSAYLGVLFTKYKKSKQIKGQDRLFTS